MNRRYSVAYSSGVNSPPHPQRLVADAPVPHLERIAVAAAAAHVRPACSCRRGRCSIRPTGRSRCAGRLRRFAAKYGAPPARRHEPHELVRAERVRILFPWAVRPLEHRGSSTQKLVRVGRASRAADAVAPVVAVGEAAARPADGAGRQAAHVIDRAPGGCRPCWRPSTSRRPRCRRRRRRRDARRSGRRVGLDAGDGLVEQDVDARIGRPCARGASAMRRPCQHRRPQEVTSVHGPHLV